MCIEKGVCGSQKRRRTVGAYLVQQQVAAPADKDIYHRDDDSMPPTYAGVPY